jgi:hypothetical protein
MPRPLYPWGKSSRDPLDRRLSGSQIRSGRYGENFWPYRDSNSDPSVVHPVATRCNGYVIPTLLFTCTIRSCHTLLIRCLYLALLVYFPYFEVTKSRLMRSQCCLCVYVFHLSNLNGWSRLYDNLDMYSTAFEPILTAYFINPSHQYVYLHIRLSLLGNCSVKISVSLLGNDSLKTLPRQCILMQE